MNDEHPSSAPPTGLFGRYALLLLSDIGCRGLRFLADVVLVRHFSQEVIGQLTLSQSLAVQGMGVSTCGLDTAGTRAVAAGLAPPSAIAVTVVSLRLLLGTIAWGAVAALAWLVPRYQGTFQLTALYGLSIVTGALTLGWVAQARNRFHVVAMASLATHLGYFGGVELATRAGWPPSVVPLLLALSEGLTAAGLWAWLVVTCGPLTRGLPPGVTLNFLRDSLPIGGAGYLRILTIGSDVLILGLFVSEADVGLYGMGFKLYSLGVSVITLYLSVLLPQLAAQFAHDPKALMPTIAAALRRSLLVVVVGTAAALPLAGIVLRLLFGAPFAAAAPAVQVLFLSLPIHLVAGHFRTGLIVIGRQRHDLGVVGTATLAHVAAKLCLIPWLGITGAAWGTLAGETVLMLLAARVAIHSGERGGGHRSE